MELLDDAQFAAQWVQAKTRVEGSRPMGRRRLTQELFQKGVSKEEVTEAVGKVTDDAELELARAAARKKVRAVPSNPEVLRTEQQKMIGFLQRRGFGWQVVKQVTREVLPAASDLEDEELGLAEE